MSEVPRQSSSVSYEKDDSGIFQTSKECIKLLKYVGIELMDHDLESLKDQVFINDQIIDFWLNFMKLNCLSEEDKARTYIFSSFFYSKLTTITGQDKMFLLAAERRHARVASWTKKEDIFKYDFILVPIVENAHWTLAIICFPGLDGVYDCDTGQLISHEGSSSFLDGNDSQCGSSSQNYAGGGVIPNIRQPCILIFDSLGVDIGDKSATLREYLRVEYKVKKGLEKIFTSYSMPGCMPLVPQQPNYYDCGVYLLQYAESFFSNPIKSFRPPLAELKNWFHSSVTQKKRRQIYDCIVELVKKENPENVHHIPHIIFDDDSPTESQENMVLQNAAEEDVDVSTDSESSTISTISIQRQPLANSQLALAPTPVRAPTPNTAAVVLDHNWIAVSKLETPMPSSVKAESVKTVKNSPVPPSTTVLNTVTNPVNQPAPPHLGNCEPSKISLFVPAFSINSTTENSSINTASSVPGKILPCYANANAPVKKDNTTKIFKITSPSEKIDHPTKESLFTVLKVPADAVVDKKSSPPVILFDVPKTPTPYITQNNNLSKIVGSQKAIIAKSPSTPGPSSFKDTRPVRNRKDTWKVKEMKNMVLQNTAEEEDVDVSTDSESSTISTKRIQRQTLANSQLALAPTPVLAPTPNTAAVVLGHNSIPVSKLETPMPSSVKAGSVKTVKNPPVRPSTTAKSPSTTKLASVGDIRPVRKRGDSWKVKEMKSQRRSKDIKLEVEVKSPHSAQSSNHLNQHMMAPIANTMRGSVSKHVSEINSAHKHDYRCLSPDIC